MAKAIADNKIGGDLYAASDLIFDDQALANAGATTSSEFLLAQTMGATQVNIVANGEVATGVGETLVITIVTSPTSGGTFDDTIWTETIAASTTVADGDQIAAFVPPRDISECYAKLVITSDFDATGASVDAYQVGVC